jgi:hypothetical protein
MQLEKGTLLRVDEGERLTRPTSSVLLVAPYRTTKRLLNSLPS